MIDLLLFNEYFGLDMFGTYLVLYSNFIILSLYHAGIVVLTKSNSGVIFCLQVLSKTLTCTHHLS